MKKIAVRCGICGANDYKEKLRKNGYKVVTCNKCGHIYVNPRLDFSTLNELYNENKISPMPYYVENLAQDKKTFEQRLKLVEKYKKKGKLLDVGCAIGTFMNVAKERGWDVKGIDLNRSSVQKCKEAGLDVICSPFEKHSFEKGSFDAIIMNDFLEHVPDPKEVLKTANGLLKKGGVILIVTPKIDSFMGKISGKKWLHLKPDEHIHFYKAKHLRLILKEQDFEVLKIFNIGRVRSLKIIIDKVKTYGKIFSKILQALIPAKVADKVWINLNLSDEMAVIARRKR